MEIRNQMTGIELVAEERRRQKEIEKFDEQHDCEYKHGELLRVAACYTAHAAGRSLFVDDEMWPPFWGECWDKRGKASKQRLLVIAAALICAELDSDIRRGLENEESCPVKGISPAIIIEDEMSVEVGPAPNRDLSQEKAE